MSTSPESAPRGFAMPRPASGTGRGAPGGTGPVVTGTVGNGTGGNGPGRDGPEPAAAPPAGQEPLAPDATVELAAEQQALRISEMLDRLGRGFVGLAPGKGRGRGTAAPPG